jgi:hypothetical protein
MVVVVGRELPRDQILGQCRRGGAGEIFGRLKEAIQSTRRRIGVGNGLRVEVV